MISQHDTTKGLYRHPDDHSPSCQELFAEYFKAGDAVLVAMATQKAIEAKIAKHTGCSPRAKTRYFSKLLGRDGFVDWTTLSDVMEVTG